MRTRPRGQTATDVNNTNRQNENTTSSIQLHAFQQSTKPNDTLSKSSKKDELAQLNCHAMFLKDLLDFDEEKARELQNFINCRRRYMAEILPILLKTLNNQSIKDLRHNRQQPVEITEGTKGDVLLKDGSGENLDPDQTDEDDNQSLLDPLFFPILEDSLEEVAVARNEPIQTVRTLKEIQHVVLLELITLFKVNPEVNYSGYQIAH